MYIKKGDLVRNLKGNLLRIKEMDYFDARLGRIPLVYDITTQVSYAHVGYLTKVEEVDFTENICIDKRVKLIKVLRKFNFIQIDGDLYKVGEIYVVNDAMIDALLRAKKWWKPHKVNR